MDLTLLSGPSNSKASSLIRAEVLSANTTIEIAVQDQDIGALLGLQGAKLNEMMTLSGAKIIVSKRGEFIEGTNNRLVTIIGSPANAQTAHTLVLNTLRQLELEDK
jgi:RNA-binding protein Nova